MQTVQTQFIVRRGFEHQGTRYAAGDVFAALTHQADLSPSQALAMASRPEAWHLDARSSKPAAEKSAASGGRTRRGAAAAVAD